MPETKVHGRLARVAHEGHSKTFCGRTLDQFLEGDGTQMSFRSGDQRIDVTTRADQVTCRPCLERMA